MKFLVLLLAALIPFSARADRIYVGLGAFHQNMFRITDNPAGHKAFLGESYFPELAAGYRFGDFFPTLGWTILGKKTHDGDKRRTFFRLDVPYRVATSGAIEFKAGGGLLIYRLYGEGSTVSIRNGNQVDQFYVPGGSRTSQIFYISGGAGWISGPWRADLDLILGGPLSTRRSLNLSLRGGYVF